MKEGYTCIVSSFLLYFSQLSGGFVVRHASCPMIYCDKFGSVLCVCVPQLPIHVLFFSSLCPSTILSQCKVFNLPSSKLQVIFHKTQIATNLSLHATNFPITFTGLCVRFIREKYNQPPLYLLSCF